MPALTDPIALRAHLGDPRKLGEYLQRPGAVRVGHYRLLSGLHSEHFLAFSQIANDAGVLGDLARLLVPSIAAWEPSGVLAPSTAGVSLGGALAEELGVPMYLASLDEGGRPEGIVGDSDLAQRRILLVNDVITTGAGMQALAHEVRRASATVAGGAWFASRRVVDVATLIDAPIAFPVSIDLPSFSPEDCPACARAATLEDGLDLN